MAKQIAVKVTETVEYVHHTTVEDQFPDTWTGDPRSDASLCERLEQVWVNDGDALADCTAVTLRSIDAWTVESNPRDRGRPGIGLRAAARRLQIALGRWADAVADDDEDVDTLSVLCDAATELASAVTATLPAEPSQVKALLIRDGDEPYVKGLYLSEEQAEAVFRAYLVERFDESTVAGYEADPERGLGALVDYSIETFAVPQLSAEATEL